MATRLPGPPERRAHCRQNAQVKPLTRNGIALWSAAFFRKVWAGIAPMYGEEPRVRGRDAESHFGRAPRNPGRIAGARAATSGRFVAPIRNVKGVIELSTNRVSWKSPI